MTFIAHASLPADNPQRAAEVLANILGGEALPFPPAGKDAWMAWSGDGNIEIEFSRRGLVLTYGAEEANGHRTGSRAAIAMRIWQSASNGPPPKSLPLPKLPAGPRAIASEAGACSSSRKCGSKVRS